MGLDDRVLNERILRKMDVGQNERVAKSRVMDDARKGQIRSIVNISRRRTNEHVVHEEARRNQLGVERNVLLLVACDHMDILPCRIHGYS